MTPLKLVALDAEDLAVISAHLQDAVAKVGDLAYLPRERRFAALLNRFDWTTARPDANAHPDTFARCRTALRFERVLAAQVQGIELGNATQVLCLLAISFEETAAPEGHVTLVFAGGSAIRLHVECIECELRDLGAVWGTRSLPQHPGDDQTGT
jgi:hypothetical protein